jgi:hypothetical protein
MLFRAPGPRVSGSHKRSALPAGSSSCFESSKALGKASLKSSTKKEVKPCYKADLWIEYFGSENCSNMVDGSWSLRPKTMRPFLNQGSEKGIETLNKINFTRDWQEKKMHAIQSLIECG